MAGLCPFIGTKGTRTQYVSRCRSSQGGLKNAFTQQGTTPHRTHCELRNAAMQRLTDADSEVLGKVIAADPSRDYVDLALSRFEKAASFRHAEALCESLVKRDDDGRTRRRQSSLKKA
jgi:hypothetical protein